MKKFDRRDFLKLSAGTALGAPFLNNANVFAADINTAAPLLLDATLPLPKILTGHLKMGTSANPEGKTLTADSRSLLLNGPSRMLKKSGSLADEA